MPFCDKCGVLVKEKDRFCGKCGATLKHATTLTCKKCGSTLNVDDVFCGKCGQAVEAKTEVPVTVTPKTDDSNKDETENKTTKMGLCYCCYNTFTIDDASKGITCPVCGESGEGSNFISNYEKSVSYGKFNIAELQSLREEDEFNFGGLGYYKWNVLNINNGYIFAILSNSNRIRYKQNGMKRGDVLTYNDTNTAVTWEHCSLRKWLNESFIERFSDEERALLAPTKVINRDNPFYGTQGGNDTIDKVFCLSSEELKFFCTNDKRKKILGMESHITESYWLRSPGKKQNEASVNTIRTFVDTWNEPNSSYAVNQSQRNDFYDEDISVRPCICINTNLIKKISCPNTSDKTRVVNHNVGDVLTFGFDEYLGPINWRVINKENNQLMIITTDVIRRKKFNNDDSFYCTWETSDIRRWLNNDFLQRNFNEDEKSHIITCSITNNKTKFLQEYIGGNNTSDRVFLLSTEEANSLFSSDDDRKCFNDWWLRTSRAQDLDSAQDSFEACYAIYVSGYFGQIKDEYGEDIHKSIGIRPVMWIRIDE